MGFEPGGSNTSKKSCHVGTVHGQNVGDWISYLLYCIEMIDLNGCPGSLGISSDASLEVDRLLTSGKERLTPGAIPENFPEMCYHAEASRCSLLDCDSIAGMATRIAEM